MMNIRSSLDKRWQELEADAKNLPQYIGPGESFHQTRRGHQTLINQEDRNLRNLEDQYDDECGGPPPPPAPAACSNGNVPTWAKVLGAGAGAAAAAACLIAEPCGAIVSGAALSGVGAALSQ